MNQVFLRRVMVWAISALLPLAWLIAGIAFIGTKKDTILACLVFASLAGYLVSRLVGQGIIHGRVSFWGIVAVLVVGVIFPSSLASYAYLEQEGASPAKQRPNSPSKKSRGQLPSNWQEEVANFNARYLGGQQGWQTRVVALKKGEEERTPFFFNPARDPQVKLVPLNLAHWHGQVHPKLELKSKGLFYLNCSNSSDGDKTWNPADWHFKVEEDVDNVVRVRYMSPNRPDELHSMEFVQVGSDQSTVQLRAMVRVPAHSIMDAVFVPTGVDEKADVLRKWPIKDRRVDSRIAVTLTGDNVPLEKVDAWISFDGTPYRRSKSHWESSTVGKTNPPLGLTNKMGIPIKVWINITPYQVIDVIE